MQRLMMEVYRMDHPDGSPRKYWCFHYAQGTLTTRWGAANKALQENAKSCTNTEVWKLTREKESKGYKHVGRYAVDGNGIDWSGASLAAVPQVDPVQTPQTPTPAPAPKFSNVLLHWTATSLPADWQKVIHEALMPLVVDGLISIHIRDTKLTIVCDGQNLEFHDRNSRARGTIEKGKYAWLLALCMVKLARHLAITVVDDDSVAVDRRYLSSKLDTLDVNYAEFDDVAEKLGLVVSKAFVKANPVIANFF